MLFLAAILFAAPAPSYEKFEPALCHPEDPTCDGPTDLEPLERMIIFLVIEEEKRWGMIQNLDTPACPIEPGEYWNLECA